VQDLHDRGTIRPLNENESQPFASRMERGFKATMRFSPISGAPPALERLSLVTGSKEHAASTNARNLNF